MSAIKQANHAKFLSFLNTNGYDDTSKEGKGFVHDILAAVTAGESVTHLLAPSDVEIRKGGTELTYARNTLGYISDEFSDLGVSTRRGMVACTVNVNGKRFIDALEQFKASNAGGKGRRKYAKQFSKLPAELSGDSKMLQVKIPAELHTWLMQSENRTIASFLGQACSGYAKYHTKRYTAFAPECDNVLASVRELAQDCVKMAWEQGGQDHGPLPGDVDAFKSHMSTLTYTSYDDGCHTYTAEEFERLAWERFERTYDMSFEQAQDRERFALEDAENE